MEPRADSTSPRVIVFAKYPKPGRVKTRMVPPLTPEEAARLHRACLEAVLERVMSMRGIGARLAVTPDEKLDAFAFELGITTGRCQRQGEGDLGTRLRHAMIAAFDEGASAVVFLGSDSPTLPENLLLDALRWLRGGDPKRGQSEVVMGPCTDGGYYLIGMSRPIPALFDGVEWGSERVAEQTRARARQSGVRLDELPEWYDIDRFEDLKRAHADLFPDPGDGMGGKNLPLAPSIAEAQAAGRNNTDPALSSAVKMVEFSLLIHRLIERHSR